MTDNPRVTLPARWFCTPHAEEQIRVAGEPRPATWAIALFEICCRDERVLRRCGWTPEGDLADTESLSAVLGEIAPLCCFLTDEQRKLSYRLVTVPGELRRYHEQDAPLNQSSDLAIPDPPPEGRP